MDIAGGSGEDQADAAFSDAGAVSFVIPERLGVEVGESEAGRQEQDQEQADPPEQPVASDLIGRWDHTSGAGGYSRATNSRRGWA
jgi:hypothetical protein